MDSYDQLATRRPTANQPLRGLTVLLVEDSRFACEAMRLLCQRSGARLRRADSIAHARLHLRTYRPCVAIIDLGLPDGDGESLIADLTRRSPRIEVILGTSGDIDGEIRATVPGADGFIPKPITNIAAFQSRILTHLPSNHHPKGPRVITSDEVSPDALAYLDDLEHIADLLATDRSRNSLEYATQFLAGIADCAQDTDLRQAATALARECAAGTAGQQHVDQLALIVDQRLGHSPRSALH